MEIEVRFTVEVDPHIWAMAYGYESDWSEHVMRTDITEYALAQVQQSPGFLDTGGTVTVKR